MCELSERKAGWDESVGARYEILTSRRCVVWRLLCECSMDMDGVSDLNLGLENGRGASRGTGWLVDGCRGGTDDIVMAAQTIVTTIVSFDFYVWN